MALTTKTIVRARKKNLSFNNNKSTNTTSQKISEKDQLHNILLMYKHKINAEDFFSLTGGYIYSTITPKNSILTNNESQNLIAGNNNYNAITFEGNFKHNIFKDYNFIIRRKIYQYTQQW